MLAEDFDDEFDSPLGMFELLLSDPIVEVIEVVDTGDSVVDVGEFEGGEREDDEGGTLLSIFSSLLVVALFHSDITFDSKSSILERSVFFLSPDPDPCVVCELDSGAFVGSSQTPSLHTTPAGTDDVSDGLELSELPFCSSFEGETIEKSAVCVRKRGQMETIRDCDSRLYRARMRHSTTRKEHCIFAVDFRDYCRGSGRLHLRNTSVQDNLDQTGR